MKRGSQDRMLARSILVAGCMALGLWFCVAGIVWAETPEQAENTVIDLEDGTLIELTKDAVIRRGKPSDTPELWSIPAKEPLLPLLFENRNGVQLLLYFIQIEEHYGEFHALRVEDGDEQWMHPVWMAHMPVSPVFVKPWIYFGQGMWLEQMNPDDGTLVARYPARTKILNLRKLPNNAIEVQAAEQYVGEFTLRFYNEQFSPRIATSRLSSAGMDLGARSVNVMEDFIQEYLDLHALDDSLLSTETVIRWRDFDLTTAEQAYREAYQRDAVNPYFALYLGLTLYYQQHHAEAESYFLEALATSAHFWEESIQLGLSCERLHLTQWADRFYEQGITRYFQDVPAPAPEASFVESGLHLPRSSYRLFANGLIDRALHVLEVRRTLFAYIQWENQFSRHYARWLRQMNREADAEVEEQRLNLNGLYWDTDELTAGSFWGYMAAIVIVFAIIILKNEAWCWYEYVLILFLMFVIHLIWFIAAVETGSDFSRNLEKSWYRVFIQLGLLLLTLWIMPVAYAGILAFLRIWKKTTPLSLWRTGLDIFISSYVVLMTGIFAAYTSGKVLGVYIFPAAQATYSPLTGKIAEIVFIATFLVGRRWIRQRFHLTSSFRHLHIFLIVWAILWGYFCWFHHYSGIILEELRLPPPRTNRGHPTWLAYIDQKTTEAPFRNQDLLFLQALVHQLGGDDEFARQSYQQFPNDARALNNLGVMLRNSDPKTALTYFEQAKEQDPDCAAALYNLGILSGDTSLIEQARKHEPWRVNVYQQYAPDKLWIVMPRVRTWSKAIYWSQGGFWGRGFVDIAYAVGDILFGRNDLTDYI